MRINKADKMDGVLVRGFKNRRLVVNLPSSLEPMAVNIPLADIRQVAVLGADGAAGKHFTVAAQIGVDRWVRLGVFASATESEAVIQGVAKAIAGSRWTNVWLMTGVAVVAGFIFTALGAYFVNSQSGPTATGAAMLPPAAMVAPAIEMPAPVAAAPAAASPTLQMTPENEAAMHDYFGTAKK